MSFRDFTPRGGGRPQGLEIENGSSSFSPRPAHSVRGKNSTPLRRSASNNSSTPNGGNRPMPMRHLDSLQYSRSQSDSTYQISPFKSYNDDTPTNNVEHSAQHTLLVQQREDEYALQVMQQREKEMQDINQKMHVVNEIYKDLGEVVHSQQEDIDNLEKKFDGAKEATRRGLEQIEKANSKKTRQRSKGGGGIGEDGEENKNGGVGVGEKRKQFVLFQYFQKSAHEIVKLVSVCGGSGSADYVDKSSWKK